ncbi:DUF5709 domain-containing protein [Nonomuraea sp. NPDC049421]|uniref:DUF5709 domain-containing protein n=1 Tax=Nonomuraea sp. NPDC049421 TaxID=3155275 RepID=UPI0034225A18
MSHHVPEHDPRSRFEDEGIPDLQDGTPQQQWAVDPQEAPLPADEPVAVEEFGTTDDEQIQGESLSGRLDREMPEDKPQFGVEEGATAGRRAGDDSDAPAVDRVTEEGGLGVGSDLDTGRERDSGIDPVPGAQPEEPSGQVWDEPRPAGRLVAADEGAHGDDEPDEIATEVGPDGGGFTAEEAAMHIEPE